MRGHKIRLLLLAVTALALVGCSENDRPLSYNKGVYSGKADTKLTPEQVRALRLRGERSN